MNNLERYLRKLDRFQQRHQSLAFTYAVVKRYGEDQTGYQSALLTYYAFLALFPLLLVLATLTQIIATTHPQLQNDIVVSITNNFPVLGGQLSAHVHSLHKNGLALVTGLLFTVYGARGVADAFRSGVNHIWQIPKAKQDHFPASALKSLAIMVIGGLGIIVVSITGGLSAATGHTLILRLAALAVSTLVLFWLLRLLFWLSLPRYITAQETRIASFCAATGLVILQLAGGYLLRRELKNLDALYSYFALALGLVFWLYLQAQIIYYSAQVAVVKSRHLWPRSLAD